MLFNNQALNPSKRATIKKVLSKVTKPITPNKTMHIKKHNNVNLPSTSSPVQFF